jgi:hypothetical protein
MKLRLFAFGAPLCVLWLLLFTVSPLSATIVLLIALAWLDRHQRRALARAHPDDEADARSK